MTVRARQSVCGCVYVTECDIVCVTVRARLRKDVSYAYEL